MESVPRFDPDAYEVRFSDSAMPVGPSRCAQVDQFMRAPESGYGDTDAEALSDLACKLAYLLDEVTENWRYSLRAIREATP